jgi:hypothetical protein
MQVPAFVVLCVSHCFVANSLRIPWEEQVGLTERLIEQARHHSYEQEVAGLEEKLRQIRQHLTLLKQMLLGDAERARKRK